MTDEKGHERITILVSPKLLARLKKYEGDTDTDASKLIRRLITDRLIAEGHATPEEELHKLC